MDSFALAYVPKSVETTESEKAFSVKMNFNLWTQCGWTNNSTVLDIGMMLYNLPEIERLRIYIPFEVKQNELTDLCSKMAANADLLGAVFNEPFSAQRLPASKFSVVTNMTNEVTEFILYSIDFEHDASIEYYKYDGVIIGTFIDIDSSTIISGREDRDYYLRFRVNSEGVNTCIKEYKAPNRFFETLVNSTYMVELRFNNTRSMDSSLVQKLTNRDNYRLAPIESLHMLLMTKVYVDVDGKFNSSRALEDKIWDSYIPEQESTPEATKDIIAYHCKVKPKEGKATIGSWEFFTRMKSGKCNLRTIVPYIVVLMIINLFSNVLTDLIITGIELAFPIGLTYVLKIAILIVVCLVVWRFYKHEQSKS